MNINRVEKIIRMHLEGYSNRKIGEEVDLSHTSVAEIISAWKEQKYEIYREAIPMEQEMIELAKYRRDKNIDTETLSNVLLLSTILKNLGLDVENVLNVAQYSKNMPAEERNTFLESARIAFDDLKKENMTYRDLSQLISKKEGEEKELQKRIEDLKKQESEINARIEKLNEDKKIAEYKINGINEEVKGKEKILREKAESIAIGEKYEQARKNMEMNDNEFFKLMRNAADARFDLRTIMKLDALETYVKRNNITTEKLERIVKGMEDLETHGIKITEVPELNERLAQMGYSLKDISKKFVDFIIDQDRVKRSEKEEIEHLIKKRKNLEGEKDRLESNIKSKREELDSIEKKLERINEFDGFLQEHKITESDFVNALDLFRRLGYSMEKINELKEFQEALEDSGYTIDVLVKDVKESLECIQYRRDLDKFGLDIETLKNTKLVIELYHMDWAELVSELTEMIRSRRRLKDLKDEIDSAERKLNDALEKIENVNDYKNLMIEKNRISGELENKRKELSELEKTLEGMYHELEKVTGGIKEYTDLVEENKRLRQESNALKNQINQRKMEIDAGLGIYELLKYSDPIKQQHMKDLAQMIVENFPYRVESLASDLRERAINALIEMTKGGVAAKVYGTGIKFMRGDEFDRNLEDFKKVREKEEWVSTELMRFQKNCISEIDNGLRNGTLPKNVLAIFERVLNKYAEEEYGRAIDEINKKGTIKSIGNAMLSISNIFMAYKGREPFRIDEKIFLVGKFDQSIRDVEFTVEEIAEQFINGTRMVRDGYTIEPHQVLRAAILSRIENRQVPLKFERVKERKLPGPLSKN